MSDDADINREIINLFIGANALAQKFSKCSHTCSCAI